MDDVDAAARERRDLVGRDVQAMRGQRTLVERRRPAEALDGAASHAVLRDVDVEAGAERRLASTQRRERPVAERERGVQAEAGAEHAVRLLANALDEADVFADGRSCALRAPLRSEVS